MTHRLVVAISSRALFDLDASNEVFEREGVEAYRQYQIEREDDVLAPGQAFPLVRKLLRINDLLSDSPVEVILLSRNTADTGLRVFNSVQHHALPIERAAFCGGESPWRYAIAFGCDLFLSTEAEDVRRALEAGIAAAAIVPRAAQGIRESGIGDGVLRLAFDGDAVLFSDEAERVYKAEGLSAFKASESAAAHDPLQGGPFRNFLATVHRIQSAFPADACPIRTALVTARSAPAHERVIRTLRHWDVRLDESLFLGGRAKGPFLKAFGADIFFDDQEGHCESAREHVTAGHVPHGIANEPSG
ncbi:MAG: 5'-nucleotidase [Pseudomonadales bacterium]|jgi:5'-nucleotidase|nr:5'-nucleotidase [Pseudomonadales bacterium]